MRLSIIRGGLHVSGHSDGTSLVVLPQQFSHCLRAHDSRVRLVRVNLMLTGVIFSGDVDTDILFDYGIFTPYCRLADLADVKRLDLKIDLRMAHLQATACSLIGMACGQDFAPRPMLFDDDGVAASSLGASGNRTICGHMIKVKWGPAVRHEFVIASIALITLLAAQWMLCAAVHGTNYTGNDGKVAQATILAALEFAGRFTVTNIGPIEGMGSQLLPMNVWLH